MRGDAGDEVREPFPALRLAALFVLPLFLGATLFIQWTHRRRSPEPALAWSDDARREVQGIVEQRFVEPLNDARAERLFDAAMRGYVGELDPFSRYFSAAERAQLDEDMSGTFGGIGVRVDAVPAGLLVVAVRRDGPAERAGIVPGETIERVGEEPLTGRDRDAMVELIKGPPETRVELWVRGTAGGEPRRVDTVRAQVESDTVPSVRRIAGPPDVGYVRIAQFADTTGRDVRGAVKGLLEQGVEGLVLDLRRNLGGVVRPAVETAALFLAPGSPVCTARTRDARHEYVTEVKDGFEPTRIPLVVLVDESSASASEILAGALQDHGRALLVGERTYGKFVMQTVIPLEERGAMLRLTTARYETPHGRSDQRDPSRDRLGGLMPDVRVPLRTRDEDDALRLEFGRQVGPAWNVLPGRELADAPPDRQLQAALDLLRGAPAPPEPVPPRAQ